MISSTYLNNSMKFQLNRISTPNVQIKLFDIAVIVKYGQGHWMWCGKVKLNKYYHYAKSDITRSVVSEKSRS